MVVSIQKKNNNMCCNSYSIHAKLTTSSIFQQIRTIRNRISTMYTVFQKTAILFFGHNFGIWTPIFISLSLLDSAGNFLQICYRDFHLTLAALLHYLAKSENPIYHNHRCCPIYSCFQNNPFLFSSLSVIWNKILSKEFLFIIYIFFTNNDVTRYAIVFVKYCIKCLFQ